MAILSPMIIADTHAHFHSIFDPDRYFDAALNSFKVFGAENRDVTMALCMADMQGQDTFDRLLKAVRRTDRWSFMPHPSDGLMITARNVRGENIYLLRGHQYVSLEGIELLGLGCAMRVDDRRLPIHGLIDKVLAGDGLPVLPWAFGKWTGSRGRVVAEMLKLRHDFLVADNGNRPRGSHLPDLLVMGERLGLGLLAGSDPLPLKNQDTRPGAVGIISSQKADHGEINSMTIKNVIKDNPSLRRYGNYPSLTTFASMMMRMQLRKRFG
jgi:hypothetical protein